MPSTQPPPAVVGTGDLGAIEPGDFLIDDQVIGHALGGFDRGPDQVGSAEGEPRPVPEHRVAPENISQRLEGHAPLAQVDRFLDFLGARDEVGHDKGRAQREDLARVSGV